MREMEERKEEKKRLNVRRTTHQGKLPHGDQAKNWKKKGQMQKQANNSRESTRKRNEEKSLENDRKKKRRMKAKTNTS